MKYQTDRDVIKLFSCSTLLSMKFKVLLSIEVSKINGIFRFKLLVFQHYEQNKSNAQLS